MIFVNQGISCFVLFGASDSLTVLVTSLALSDKSEKKNILVVLVNVDEQPNLCQL